MDGFIVAYEYGTGAAWAFVRAETTAEVVSEFPELNVYETPPEWMTIADVHRVRSYAAVEINGDNSLDNILEASRRLSVAVAS